MRKLSRRGSEKGGGKHKPARSLIQNQHATHHHDRPRQTQQLPLPLRPRLPLQLSIQSSRRSHSFPQSHLPDRPLNLRICRRTAGINVEPYRARHEVGVLRDYIQRGAKGVSVEGGYVGVVDCDLAGG